MGVYGLCVVAIMTLMEFVAVHEWVLLYLGLGVIYAMLNIIITSELWDKLTLWSKVRNLTTTIILWPAYLVILIFGKSPS